MKNIKETKIISAEAIKIRNYWVKRIASCKGNFSSNSELIEKELSQEVKKKGYECLINHLRLCGNIPEAYGHDTSEEKQYSKYTDTLLCLAYKKLGVRSLVLVERADIADVEGYTKEFAFVADAKAFRLSRTAKNQKDFKVQAMDRWKYGKPFAMVVCPIYQLPNRTSQIYEQAITRNVCIFTYSHLSLLVRYANEEGTDKAKDLLHTLFNTVPAMNPSKNATDYWLGINKTMLSYSKPLSKLWQDEKIASVESIHIAKNEALKYLIKERKRIMKLSHEEALKQLVKSSKIENKISTVKKTVDSGLLEIK